LLERAGNGAPRGMTATGREAGTEFGLRDSPVPFPAGKARCPLPPDPRPLG